MFGTKVLEIIIFLGTKKMLKLFQVN